MSGFALSSTQLEAIRAYGNAKNYASMYAYIGAEMRSGAIAGVPSEQIYWFEQAALINAGQANSPAATFIRAVTSRAIGGEANSPRMTAITNAIAANVFADISNLRAIPPFSQQLKQDIAVALDDANMTIGQWGGSFYYWDKAYKTDSQGRTITVGQAIMSDPRELEAFKSAFAYGFVQVILQHGSSVLDDPNFEVAVGGGVKLFKQETLLTMSLFPAVMIELARQGIAAGSRQFEDAINGLTRELLRQSGWSIISGATNTASDFAQQVSLGYSDIPEGATLSEELVALLDGRDLSQATIQRRYEMTDAGRSTQLTVIEVDADLKIYIDANARVSYLNRRDDGRGGSVWEGQSFSGLRFISSTFADGRTMNTVTGPDGVVLTSTETQTFEDGSRLVTEISATGTRTVTGYDTAGLRSGTMTETTYGTSENRSFFDAAGNHLRTTATNRFDDGSRAVATTYPDGGEIRETFDSNNTLVSRTGTSNGLDSFGSFVTDLNSVIGAIRSGDPVPILSSGLRLINSQANPVVNGAQVINNQPLFTATAVVGAAASIYSLYNAFNDDAPDDQKVLAVANSVVAVNAAANAVYNTVNGTVGEVASQTLSGVASGVAQALPWVSAAISIKNGDYTGAAISVVAYFVPVIGWLYAIYSIIKAINDEPPEAWATAKVEFANPGDTTIKVSVVGDAFGPDRVRFLYEGDNKPPSDPTHFGGLLGYLNDVVANAQSNNPAAALGIIPQRLASITWREARQGDPGYAMVEIDPLTGAERFPGLRYNDNFLPYNADATDPEQRRDIFQRMVDSAVARQAIAPMWEVQTARMRQDLGDPNAGLTETEAAAKRGEAAQYDSNNHRIDGQFRPIALDLNGDGRINVLSNDQASARYDWNSSGFVADTGWLASGEGFLCLDRNFNGSIETGLELFSNADVSDDAKGVRSLAWVDANGDGTIDASDPVFQALQVWRDDGDGTQEAGELSSLSSLGITSLEYLNGRFVRNGQYFALQSQALETSAEGLAVAQVTGGIQVTHSDGRSTLVVSQVINTGTGTGGGTGGGTNGLVVSNEAFLAPEDGFTAGHPNYADPSARQSISVTQAQLLANDVFNGVAVTGLSISSVQGAEHGSVSLDAALGLVSFLPDLNYFGSAAFTYTVTAPDGSTAIGRVDITLTAVDDRPIVSVSVPDRPVYGYAVLVTSQSVDLGSDNGSATQYTVSPGDGEVLYSPYQSVGGRLLVAQSYYNGDTEVTTYSESGPVVDTNVPVDYFNTEVARLNQNWNWENPPPAYLTIRSGGNLYAVPLAPQTFAHNTPIATEAGNDGQVVVSDVEGSSTFSFSVSNNPLYGEVSIDANTGAFTYTGRRYVTQDIAGNNVMSNVVTDVHVRSESPATSYDSFTVKVVDTSDASGQTFTYQTINVPHYGALPAPDVASGGKKPIAIDLGGDGFQFINIDDSNVYMAANEEGWRRKMAWVGPSDGVLVYDENGNGKLDSVDEITFARLLAGAQTDLEGLRALDTNGDGQFSSSDAKWSAFSVWQDANSNGQVETGEMRGLADLGIASISLASDGHFQVINGQTVHGIGQVTKADGSQLALADVTLQARNETTVTNSQGASTTATVTPFSTGLDLIGTVDSELAFGTTGNDRFRMGGGNDAVTDDGGNDFIEGEAGDDKLLGGADNDVIDGGAGADILFGGSGNDLLLGGLDDDVLAGEQGNDVLMGGGGQDMLSGGSGNDLLSGDQGNDRLFGEGGRDQLLGQAGDDDLFGMGDDDVLYGGEGNDLLSGGEGADLMEGGFGNDTYEVDDFADQVIEIEGEGEDLLMTHFDTSLSLELENLSLLGTAAIGTGNAKNNVLVGNASNNTLSGLAGDDLLDGAAGADLMIGGTGDDTYRVQDSNDQVQELANEGHDLVESSISYTLAQHVEDLVLTGIANSKGTGNDLNNRLLGNSSSNTLDGGLGADDMRGGRGDDIYQVNEAADQTIELLDQGRDLVEVTGVTSWTLAEHIEELNLLQGAVAGTGNALNNVLRGNEAANTLDGSNGDDLMIGRGGDDTYVVDAAGDVVLETENNGVDTVLSSISFGLASHVENLILTGNATINATGNALGNVLTGNSSNNLLDGAGGADTLNGGAGDDTYVVDNAADLVVELAIQGNDKVLSSVTYTLSANVEQLQLTGSASIDALGNALDNILTGNDGNNILDGAAGADVMSGGAGDDTYVVDGLSDQVVELAGLGFDRVHAAISYVLPEHVEAGNLEGTALRLTGNALDNHLVGNSQANILIGGVGLDTMQGGAGDDRYAIDQASDQIIEQAAQGIDTAISSASYVLADNVEHLVLQGSSAINATGNVLDNVLVGNASANTLIGLAGADVLAGGQGNDLLQGGSQADTYLYFQGDGSDIIEDESGTDTLRFGAGIRLDSIAVRASTQNGTAGMFVALLDTDGMETADGVFVKNGQGSGAIETIQFVGNVSTSFTSALITTVTTNGTNQADVLTGSRNDDIMVAGNGADILDGGLGRDQLYGESGNDALYGGGERDSLYAGDGNDLVAAGAGNDFVDGGNGNDVIIAGKGDDQVLDGNGNDFVDAGAGIDTLGSGKGNDFIAAGSGNDFIDSGEGFDLIAFNRGDGQDTLAANNGSDVISLGGGIRYADLKLSRTGNNLTLKVGNNESIILEGWYAATGNRSVSTLQIATDAVGGDYVATSSDRLINRRNVSFNFSAIVSQFDSARLANPSLGDWSLSASLNAAYLAGSDTQALGGNFARRYSLTGSYGDLSTATIVSSMATFNAQTWMTTSASTAVNPWVALQAGVRLTDPNAGLPSPITPQANLTEDELAFIALGASTQIPSWRGNTAASVLP